MPEINIERMVYAGQFFKKIILEINYYKKGTAMIYIHLKYQIN